MERDSRKISFTQEDIDDVKRRMRELSEMNQELRMRNSELQKHLDEALKLVFKNKIEILESAEGVSLKPISFENARTILFTGGFNQLAYLYENELTYIDEKSRRFAYDNAEKFKWFIWNKKEHQVKAQSELPIEVEEKEEKTFKGIFHKVRIQDLPAYLKIFRYEEKLKTSDITVVAQSQWAKYERGVVEPSYDTVKKLAEYCNIEVVYETGMKTIRIHGFGDRLRDSLKKKRMKQSELADKLGVQQANISNYINRNYYPLANVGVMNKIAEVLDESICYLLTGTREWE